ncbi:MAG: poly(R)-hydroxyalkanoic acid synthase subunit PhaE [Pseudomonadota bacterium]
MPSSSENDINLLFGQWLSQWEDLTNSMANTLMRTDQYGKGQNAALNTTLAMRKSVQKQMARLLEASNMPSREEVSELHGAVGKMDQRLARVEQLLEQLVEAQIGEAATKDPVRFQMPPRTRKPSHTQLSAKSPKEKASTKRARKP